MACSPTSPADAGYATPLATAVCLALTLGVGALAVTSAAELKQARRDLTRRQAEFILAGAQATAAAEMVESRSQGRLLWTMATDLGPAEVLAEPEAAKVGYETAAELDDGVLRSFDVVQPDRLKSRLRALALPQATRSLADADISLVWRACAPSLISRYGLADQLQALKTRTPDRDGLSWRAGQAWRMRLSAGGWVDDRTVRFTGDPERPAALVARRFARGENVGSKCDRVFDAVTATG